MPCQAPAKTTKAMTHFRKQNKIHAGQTTVSHNQHDTLSNKHNINVKLRFIVCKNRDKLLATHITHQEKNNPSKCFRQTVIHNPWLTSNYQTTIHATIHPKNRGIPGTQPMPNIKQTVRNPYNKRNTWSAKRNPYAKQERCTIHDITSQSMRLRVTMMNNPRHKSIKQHHNPCNNTARKHENQSTTYTKQQIRSMQQHVTQRPRKHDTQSMTHTHQATNHNPCNNLAAKKPW